MITRVSPTPQETSQVPTRAGLVLVALILAAAVANLELSVAHVALPTIGQAFDASQTDLNLIAVGSGLGLAASVLGAIGDRYGRKPAGTSVREPRDLGLLVEQLGEPTYARTAERVSGGTTTS